MEIRRHRTRRSGVLALVVLAVPVLAGVLVTGCDPVSRSEGEKLWRQHCASCHGIDGGGTVPKYRKYAGADLMDDNWFYGDDDGSIETVIREGIFPTMPALDNELTHDEVRKIIRYLREMRGET